MFFPVKKTVTYFVGDTRRTKKFAWWPVRIESYGRHRGTVWLEHYDYVEECASNYPSLVWKEIGTVYPSD